MTQISLLVVTSSIPDYRCPFLNRSCRLIRLIIAADLAKVI